MNADPAVGYSTYTLHTIAVWRKIIQRRASNAESIIGIVNSTVRSSWCALSRIVQVVPIRAFDTNSIRDSIAIADCGDSYTRGSLVCEVVA